jgi:hypothetical protein
MQKKMKNNVMNVKEIQIYSGPEIPPKNEKIIKKETQDFHNPLDILVDDDFGQG